MAQIFKDFLKESFVEEDLSFLDVQETVTDLLNMDKIWQHDTSKEITIENAISTTVIESTIIEESFSSRSVPTPKLDALTKVKSNPLLFSYKPTTIEQDEMTRPEYSPVIPVQNVRRVLFKSDQYEFDLSMDMAKPLNDDHDTSNDVVTTTCEKGPKKKTVPVSTQEEDKKSTYQLRRSQRQIQKKDIEKDVPQEKENAKEKPKVQQSSKSKKSTYQLRRSQRQIQKKDIEKDVPQKKEKVIEKQKLQQSSKSRYQYTEEQIQALEKEFATDEYCKLGRKVVIGKKLDMDPDAVLNWFTNARRRQKSTRGNL